MANVYKSISKSLVDYNIKSTTEDEQTKMNTLIQKFITYLKNKHL
jgi:hypothetical protein